MNRKTRRHSGRFIEVLYHPEDFPYEKVYWNDWLDYRDSFRNPVDNTKIRKFKFYNVDTSTFNKKIKLLLKRRKAMKDKILFKLGLGSMGAL